MVDGEAELTYTSGIVVSPIPAFAIGVNGSFVQTKPLDLAPMTLAGMTQGPIAGVVKFIEYVRFDIDTDDGSVPDFLFVKFGWQVDLADPIQWTPFTQIDRLNPRIPIPGLNPGDGGMSGRYLTVYMLDQQPSIPWKWTRMELYGRFMGQDEGTK